MFTTGVVEFATIKETSEPIIVEKILDGIFAGQYVDTKGNFYVKDELNIIRNYNQECEFAPKLSRDEYLAYKSFQHTHSRSHKGTTSIIFTPTGIGYTKEVRCDVCGETVDITDYLSW